MSMTAHNLPEDWEPKILEEGVVARGHWFYQNLIKYSVSLIRRKWNYTPLQLDQMYQKAIDYVPYDVSDEGIEYHWLFEMQGSKHTSGSFSSCQKAKGHIDSYSYIYDIDWMDNDI